MNTKAIDIIKAELATIEKEIPGITADTFFHTEGGTLFFSYDGLANAFFSYKSLDWSYRERIQSALGKEGLFFEDINHYSFAVFEEDNQ